MPNLALNLALVGVEHFTVTDRQRVTNAVAIMRQIYLAIDIHFSIDRFKLTADQAGPFVHINGPADAQALTEKAAGPGNAIDMFVVRTMGGTAVGWSPVNGTCDKKRKGQTGVVVSLMDATDAETGNTFAHELGHYLGLAHCPDANPACSGNFISPQSKANTSISAEQAATMKRHCAVSL